MTKNNIELETIKIKWYEYIWLSIKDFTENWIYPAYYLKNFLFNRYDIVKLSNIARYKYLDVDERMFLANMSLIIYFIEKEQPEKYVLWYKDEQGKDIGHKYGEYKEYTILFPEYKDKFIMDIIKEIYNWYKIEYPLLNNEISYLLSFWTDNIVGEMKFETKDYESEDELYDTFFDNSNCPKTLEELKQKKNINWDIIHKYIPNDEDIFKENFVHNKITELQNKCYNEKQKYLHLCIEVRPYLWI